MSRTVALIPAAGIGRRMARDGKSKPYICLAQRPIICYVLEMMANCVEIDRMVIIVSREEIQFCEEHVVPKVKIRKPYQIVIGGAHRQESVFKGLKALEKKPEIVLIHDAVRPFTPTHLFQECILEARKFGACIVGIPVRDTLKRLSAGGVIEKTVPRASLWMAQTPQAFHFDLLWEAHQKALQEEFLATDDAQLVERLGFKVKIINGSFKNIKITYPEDLQIAENWFRL